MANRCTGRAGNERGAMLVHVGITLLVLMSFAVFVVDYGVLLMARGQAQNAADAAALSGATSRAYDQFTNPPPAGGLVEQAARGVAAQHRVTAQLIPAATVGVSYACPPGVTGGGCVQVDVFRNGQNGSTNLPVFFGPLLGVNSQGVRATATAQAVPANAMECLKPWAVADKWLESNPPWTQQSTFNPAQGDVYIPPYGTQGTGFSRTDANNNPVDVGMQLTLKLAHPGNGTTSLSSGWAMSLDLPNAGGGANQYNNNIVGCTPATIGIAPEAEQCNAVNLSQGCISVLTGGMTGQTRNGVEEIVSRDSGASWSRTTNAPTGSSASGISPRIVPVALFDTATYMSRGYNGTNGIVKVVNFLGFFVEGLCSDNFYKEAYLDCSNNNNDVVGRLMSYPGVFSAGAGEITGPSAFGIVIRLVR